MKQSTATRRLVKSPPELWAELSTRDSLGRHLAEFGDIRITRVEPETTVAWEGDRASGTVQLAPAGWGTKVILTATPATATPAVAARAESELAPVAPSAAVELARARNKPRAQPAPPPPPPPAPPAQRRGFFARLFRKRAPAAAPQAEAKPASAVTGQASPAPAGGIPGPPAPGPAPVPPTPSPQPGPIPPPAPDPVPPTPVPQPPPPPQIKALDPARTVAILTEVLDDLGAAHHRPFSRD
jgi:hypothetical protein